MPRGGRRIGAGRPARPVAEHIQRGTYRRDRHGDRPVIGNLAVMPHAGSGWAPSDQDVAALTKPGRAFLDSLLAEFEFNGIEGKLALEAAHAVDRLKAIRRVSTKAETLREVAAIERLDQGWSKLLTGLLVSLKVSR